MLSASRIFKSVAILQDKRHFFVHYYLMQKKKNAGRSIKRFCFENPGDSKTGYPFHELLTVDRLLGE